MQDMFKKNDDILKKPYYMIDFLPQRVSETAKGHFFDTTYLTVKNIRKWKIKVLTATKPKQENREGSEEHCSNYEGM